MEITMSDTRYSKDHEWVRRDGDTVTIGISVHAQEQLGDVVFVEVPEVGRTVAKGDAFAVVESVKAASDVYAPVGGEVVEANGALADKPELVNSGAESEGWLCKLKLADAAELEGLMDATAYQALVASLD
jgi:glycine cleavage system H protein